MKKFFMSLCAAFGIGIAPLFAVPANPKPLQVTQPDGSMITVQLVGDEFNHYKTTLDGIPVTHCEDGFYRYTEMSPEGVPVAGQVIARDANIRSAFDNSYLNTLSQEQVATKLENRPSLRKQRFQQDLVHRAAQATTTGEVHGLVLLVEFSDTKLSSVGQKSDMEDMMNQEGYDYCGAIGSARDYFIAQSGGQFQPIFDVVGPITLDNTMAYYGGNNSSGGDARAHEMIIDACRKAETMTDFSLYDQDNDQIVDLVYVIYAGYSEASYGGEDTVWPHAWWIIGGAGQYVQVDGLYIDAYACSAELSGNSGTIRDGIGTFCHEYSHTLGLPDFYDTSGRTNNYGMGKWSVMDYGCYNGPGGYGNSECAVPVGYMAYEREFCGWMTIDELTEPQAVTLEYLADSRQAYKIVSNSPNQYFILENRQQTGWDTYMESSGLMIVKVDYDRNIWSANTVNNTASRQRMTIIPADNRADMNSERGDLYPYNGNSSFTRDSSPASKTNTAGYIDKPVTNIAQDGDLITFDFMGGSLLPKPEVKPATQVSQTGFTANWSVVEGATHYSLYVSRRDPNASGEILLFEDCYNCTAASTENIAGTLVYLPIDSAYTRQSGWEGRYIFPEVGKFKLGNSTKGGALRTPVVDLSSCGGTFTVQFKAQMYSGISENSVAMKVFLESDKDNAQTTPILSVDEMGTYKMVFTGGTADSRIVFESTAETGKKRAYITDIVIFSGDMSSESSVETDTTWPMEIPNLTDTSYILSDLDSNFIYYYQVKAFNDEYESAYSDKIKVDLNNPDAIEGVESFNRVYVSNDRIVVECETEQPVTVVNVAGQTLVSTQVSSRTELVVPVGGLYIVRCGMSATRVVVR